MEKQKSYQEINQKIKKGDAVVLTAEEMSDFVEQKGEKQAFKKVDVVTTATFGAMCSSGAFLNFGHSDPPIKMTRAWLNNVLAYAGMAAVDVYLGATQPSEDKGIKYGGAHVIEDLLKGNKIHLKATSQGTDSYPRKQLDTYITLDDINQAYLFNPRNCYQNYSVAVNSSNKEIHTYMGTLLPNFGNATYSSAGQLSPLLNDPYYKTIGIGTKILLGGANGYIAWEGTQHEPGVKRNKKGIPTGGAGTIAVVGNLKDMNPEYIRAASIKNYGVSLYVGIGIPIPIINQEMVKYTSIKDKDIYTTIHDYSDTSRNKAAYGQVNYNELRSGSIKIKNKEINTAPLSSYKKAREIALELKKRISNKNFTLEQPVKELPKNRKFKSLEIKKEGE